MAECVEDNERPVDTSVIVEEEIVARKELLLAKSIEVKDAVLVLARWRRFPARIKAFFILIQLTKQILLICWFVTLFQSGCC